jgi:DNA-binding SARP family transcriptional activator
MGMQAEEHLGGLIGCRGIDTRLPGTEACVRISLMGPVRLWAADGSERMLPTRRAKALLAYLTLARGRSLQRSALAALLWERSAEGEARASLRKAVSALAAGFKDAPAGQFVAGRDDLRLDASRCEVDLFRLDEGEISDAGASDGTADESLLILMEGLEGLGEAWDDWLATERTRAADQLRALREAALDRCLADPGASEAAIRAARRLLAVDDTHEGAWRSLMQLLADGGDRTRALQEYQRCRAALRNGLDVEPSAATRDLAQRIRASQGLSLRVVTATPREFDVTPSERPLRVGVLPFTAAGLGPESAEVALAYAREVALELARFRRFDIISPMTLAERERHLHGRDANAALGLDYLIDGSIRDGIESRTIVASLLDVSEVIRPVWSDRVPLHAHMRGVDGNVVETLVARLDPAILSAAGSRPTTRNRTDATTAVLKAIPLLYSMRRDRVELAGELLAEAVVAEPENAVPAAWAAQWHVFHAGQGWARDPIAELKEAERLAILAMRLDPDNAEGFGIYGHVCAFLHKDFSSAVHFLDRSLAMNPNQASMWALSAPTHCYLGDPAEAQRRLMKYRSLVPHHPHAPIFEPMFTMTRLFSGDYEGAVEIGTRAVQMAPDFINGYKALLAAMGHRRQRREARPFLQSLLTREPGFTVREFVRTYPFKRTEDRDRYGEGLALAGVPMG